MHIVLKIWLAAAAALAASAAATPAAAQARAQWQLAITACRMSAGPAGAAVPADPRTAMEPLCRDEQLGGLIAPEAIPASLRRRRFDGLSRVVLDVAPTGVATGCRVTETSGEARLDRIACGGLLRGRFAPFYSAPRRPVPSEWHVAVEWEISDVPLPPRMPLPPRLRVQTQPIAPPPWPQTIWFHALEPVALPPIQADFPESATRDGRVGLDLTVSAERGIEACAIAVSSGDAALDAAACRVAGQVELRYARPCERCRTSFVPLQVVWRRAGGSHIRFPLASPLQRLSAAPALRDPADTRTAAAHNIAPRALPFEFAADHFRGIADRRVTNAAPVAEVVIGPEGRVTACRLLRTSGNEAVDRRLCAVLVEQARYEPLLDIFGDPIESRPIERRVNLRGIAQH